MLIVRPATKLQIGDRGFAAVGKRNHMMELKSAAFAAATLCSDECTAAPITPPHRTFC
jgi:hypothetical protein